MTKQKLKIQKAPKSYKLDPEKLSELPQRVFALVMCDTMYFSEDYKYFDVIKPYLDIPEEPKSLEELKQELDEKIDKLIEKTKEKFAYSKEGAEYYYNEKFDGIFSNFQYAKKYGHFPEVRIAKTGRIDYSKFVVSGGSNQPVFSVSSASPSFIVKPQGYDIGYYTFGTIRIWEKTKPSLWVRTFAKILLNLEWEDAQ